MADVLTVREQLGLFGEWLAGGLPFFHARFNDGEASTMFYLTSPTLSCSGEHRRFLDLGATLRKTIDAIAAAGLPRVLIGSDCWRETRDLWAVPMRKWAAGKPVTWGAGDVWYSTAGEERGEVEDCLPLLRALAGLDAVLVTNAECAAAVKPLPRRVIVPGVDAWLDKTVPDRVAAVLDQDPAAVVVWAAGLPAKVWAWALWQKYPMSSHLDAGHLFDYAAGKRTRAWHFRAESAHRAWYVENVIPFLEGGHDAHHARPAGGGGGIAALPNA